MKLFNLVLGALILVASLSFAETHESHSTSSAAKAHPISTDFVMPQISQSFAVLPEDDDAVDYDGRELKDIKIKNAVTLLEGSSCAKDITEKLAKLLENRAAIENVLRGLRPSGLGVIQSVEFKLEFEKNTKGTCDGRIPRLKVKMAYATQKEVVIEQVALEFQQLDWRTVEKGIQEAWLSVIKKYYAESKSKAAKELELFKKNPLSRMPVLLKFFK